MTFYPNERLGMFIDGANLYSAARGLDFDIDYRKLLDEFRKRALDAGCDGFITKPIEPAELVDRVKRLVLTAKVRRNELQPVGS